MDRKKNRIIAFALIAAAIVLFVFGILALPENIVIQVASSGEPNRMGKKKISSCFQMTPSMMAFSCCAFCFCMGQIPRLSDVEIGMEKRHANGMGPLAWRKA